MKTEKILFLISLLNILILTILAKQAQTVYSGKISSIEYSQSTIKITLENFNESLLLFEENERPSLSKGDEIFFKGKKEKYFGEAQRIISWIKKV